MAFNGSGTYTLPGAALNTGDTVSATENNTLRNDMATAFNKTLCRDGQATPTANLPMGGFKHTGLAAGTTAGDSVRYEQLPSGSNVLAEGSGGTGTTTGYYGFKNRIINGAMMIDQRNAGASVTPSNTGNLTYIVDRFAHYSNVASKLTYQQVADAPSGFRYSTKITVASQYSPVTTDQFQYYQAIEGYNVADLNFGLSTASTITISFWVKSSVAGTYNIFFYNAAASRWYATTYTATTSWAQQTVTFTGDITGTWATDNTTGIWVGFDLGQGASNLGTTGAWSGTQTRGSSSSTKFVAQANGATFQITGVQLEKGSTATSFDYRPYGTELQLCQRYYYRVTTSQSYSYYCSGGVNSTTAAYLGLDDFGFNAGAPAL